MEATPVLQSWARELLVALSTLDPLERGAIESVYFHGSSPQQVAEAHRVSTLTVDRWLGRGMRNLGAALRELERAT